MTDLIQVVSIAALNGPRSSVASGEPEAINVLLDAGVLWELIRRRTDLRPVREQFLAAPRETARILMSRLWR